MMDWISVDEKLPSRDGMYIVTKKKDGISERSSTWAMYNRRKKKFYLPGGRVDFYIEVEAWMPFPKPYKD